MMEFVKFARFMKFLASVFYIYLQEGCCSRINTGLTAIKQSEEERLMEYLFRGYNPSARPVLNSSDTVNVTLQFSLLQIQELNVRNQVLTTTGLLILDWVDERLKWTEKISSLDELVIHGENIWRPEFAVINGAESIYGDYKEFQAVLRSNGSVRWEPGGVFKTMCSIDITYYPFDDQRCNLTFGAWSYYTRKMNLTTVSTRINLDTYEKNGEWQITSTTATRNEFWFICCPDYRFSNIAFTVELRRRHTFYIMNVILPGILTSAVLLSIFFCIPSQKIHIGVAALLSFRLFLVNVSDTIPRTSDHVPLLGIYLTCTMAITTLAMVATVIVGNLYDVKDRPVPSWARRLFIIHIARLLCMCNCFAPQYQPSSISVFGSVDDLTITDRDQTEIHETLREDDASPDTSRRAGGKGRPTRRSLSCDARSPRRRARKRQSTQLEMDQLCPDGSVLFTSGSREPEPGRNGSPATRTRDGMGKRASVASRLRRGVSLLGRVDSNVERKPSSSSLNSEVGSSLAAPVRNRFAEDWSHVAAVCDRFFFWLCLIFIVATTLLLFHPLTKYTDDEGQ